VSLLGVDIGSTNCKAILFDAEGRQLATASREYAEVYPGPGMIELPADDVWAAVRDVVREVSAAADDTIQAVCFSAIGEAFTPVARDGSFLHNTIVSADNRAVAQAERLGGAVGARRIFEITGMPVHPSFTVNKVMWLREHKPDIYAQTWKYLSWPDAAAMKLGLEPRLDWTEAGRTMAFDVVNKRFSEEVLAAAGVDAGCFAEPIASGKVVGEIGRAASEETGLPVGCLVVAGGHDQPMNALGAGAIRNGLAVDGMGTVECITVAFEKPVLTEAMRAHNHCCYPHVVEPLYVSLAYNYSSGAVLRWFRDNFGAVELAEAERTGRDVYDVLLEGLPEAPTDLYLVPYMAGSGTPYLDPLARGMLVGLTLGTDRKTLLKGLLEGICYELALNIEGLHQAGVPLTRLRCTGGGSRSPLWMQLKADITGLECVRLRVSESGCQAAAILGGVAAGVYASPDEAVELLVHEDARYEPRAGMVARYVERLARYKELWPAARDVVHRMHEVGG
jgi:xylulokinase